MSIVVTPDVLSLLRQRRDGGTSVVDRDDPFHAALVIEGGGMRGTYAAGMLLALQKGGLLNAFDSVHGSSVGAHLATYFVTGEAEVGRDIFLEEALDPRFISPWHMLVGRPVMDVTWMVQEVFAQTRRMKLERLTAERPALRVIATDVATGHAVSFRGGLPESDFFRALIATAKIPIVAGAPLPYAGGLLTDGGIAEQIPLPSAVSIGATHVLVLTTGRQGRIRKDTAHIEHRAERQAIALLYGEALARAYDARRGLINRVLDALQAPIEGGPALQGVFVPDAAPVIKRLTKDRADLAAAAALTEEATRRLVGA